MRKVVWGKAVWGKVVWGKVVWLKVVWGKVVLGKVEDDTRIRASMCNFYTLQYCYTFPEIHLCMCYTFPEVHIFLCYTFPGIHLWCDTCQPLDEIVTVFVHKYSVIMSRPNMTSRRHLIRETGCQDTECFILEMNSIQNFSCCRHRITFTFRSFLIHL